MTDRSLFNLVAPLATARGSRLLSLTLCVAMLSACAIGPDYQRPAAAAPVQYKEAEGWRPANPSAADRKSVVWGRGVSDRDNPGCRRLIKKKNTTNIWTTQ